MKLGNGMYIVRNVRDIESSSSFYERLGYTKLDEGENPTKYSLFSDARLNLMIKEGRNNSTNIVYFNKNLDSDLDNFKDLGVNFHTITRNEDNSEIRMALFTDPDGLEVSILNEIYNENHKLMPKDSDSTVEWGKFGEYSLLVNDFEKSENFWNALGFKTMYKAQEPYPFGILYDDMFILGLHQTADYTKITTQSITYFHPKMDENIKSLQNKGFEFRNFSEGKVETGQAVLKSPDGLVFFLFKGSI